MGKKKAKNDFIRSEVVTKRTFELLEERGVDLLKVAEIVLSMQKSYNPDLTVDECLDSVKEVLEKRELQHAILVGIELDKLAEEGLLSEPLQSLVEDDEGLFGIDETIAIGATFGFGSIAVTTFGHLDKEKIGVIKDLDEDTNHVHTFLDDLVGVIAANASARIAHKKRDAIEQL